MKLEVLTRGQCQLVREWRNNELQAWRTPYMLTEKMQDNFYDDIVQDRNSKHRYFAIMGGGQFIGMGGLTNIEWENGTAEISLIINPNYRRKRCGTEAVDLLLDEAFDRMRLYSVHGEEYACGCIEFWSHIIDRSSAYSVKLQDRKFYNGIMYDSMWFSIKG